MPKEEIFWKIIKSPYFSEKSQKLAQKNQYTFLVYPDATKADIKRAIEEYYKVKVKNVKIINLPAKKKRWGLIEGKKEGFKKAIVRIEAGQKIEFFPT